MKKLLNRTVILWKERLSEIFIDTLVMGFSYLFAIALRFEFAAPHWGWPGVVFTFGVVLIVQWFFLLVFKCRRTIWKYISASDVPRFFISVLSSTSVLIILRLMLPHRFSVRPPLSISLMNGVFVFGGLLLVRILKRLLQDGGRAGQETVGLKRVLLVGAGDAGNTVVREIRSNNLKGYELIGLLDDDHTKQGAVIQGFAVLGAIDDLPEIVRQHHVDEVIVTMVCVPKEVIRRVFELCRVVDVEIRILPAFHELINGSVKISRLRNVKIADLLGREEAKFDDAPIIDVLAGKTVMVTGAGGSIGSELVRQTARMGVEKIILFERYENALYNIERELLRVLPGSQLVAAVGDVCDSKRVEEIFRQYKPHIVIHAAAHKHVPMMETNPGEALKNNVLGTATVAETAVKFGADQFVLVSTDKAVNPVCVMGFTKRMAEMVVQKFNTQGETRFSAVRFGNVLGSAGSVVPLFEEQIARGGPVTVTHPEMQRYFMTIEEAAHLILLSLTRSTGGEIFVLDMGEPVKILEMAETMIRLSGLTPYEDIPISFIGVRPGEKLSEDLNVSEASVLRTDLARIYISKVAPADPAVVSEMLEGSRRICLSCMTDKQIREQIVGLGVRD